jgi:hypothetical protein
MGGGPTTQCTAPMGKGAGLTQDAVRALALEIAILAVVAGLSKCISMLL